MKIIIKGVIVYDANNKSYRFCSAFLREDFKKGALRREYLNYVLVCEHEIQVDVQEVDLIGPQLDALDEKEKELTSEYQRRKAAIQAERQKLLALEFEA